MHSYHTRQECITHKQNKHSTIIFTDFRREATINIGTDIHIYTGNPSVLGGISF